MLSDSAPCFHARKKPPKFLSPRDRNLGGTTLINAFVCILLLLPLSPVLRCAPHAGLRVRFRTVPVKASHHQLSLCNVSHPYYSLLRHVFTITPALIGCIFIHFRRMNWFCQLYIIFPCGFALFYCYYIVLSIMLTA